MGFRKLDNEKFEAFDPEEVAVLEQAFQRACEFIKQGGEAGELDEAAAKKEIALHVFAAAEDGENNVLRITNLAIQRFRLEREKMRSILRRQAP
jgi:hypothetical protein